MSYAHQPEARPSPLHEKGFGCSAWYMGFCSYLHEMLSPHVHAWKSNPIAARLTAQAAGSARCSTVTLHRASKNLLLAASAVLETYVVPTSTSSTGASTMPHDLSASVAKSFAMVTVTAGHGDEPSSAGMHGWAPPFSAHFGMIPTGVTVGRGVGASVLQQACCTPPPHPSSCTTNRQARRAIMNIQILAVKMQRFLRCCGRVFCKHVRRAGQHLVVEVELGPPTSTAHAR